MRRGGEFGVEEVTSFSVPCINTQTPSAFALDAFTDYRPQGLIEPIFPVLGHALVATSALANWVEGSYGQYRIVLEKIAMEYCIRT